MSSIKVEVGQVWAHNAYRITIYNISGQICSAIDNAGYKTVKWGELTKDGYPLSWSYWQMIESGKCVEDCCIAKRS